MKRLFFLLSLTLAAGCDHPFVAADLAGAWVRQADEDTYRLTFQAAPGWSLAEGGSFTLFSERLDEAGSGFYTLDGDMAVFLDDACRAGDDDVPGAYRLQFDGATLRIGAVDDACAARRRVLSGTWHAGD